MGSNSNVLNVRRLLFMVLFSAVLFNSLFVNADGETFKLSKNNTSAKALVGEKKFEANVTFIASDYTDKEDRSFNLTVGGCELVVKARKKSQNVTSFDFYNKEGANLKNVNNPKSFSTESQRLIFHDSDGINKVYVDCNQEISFVPIEGGEFYLEVSLDGEILGLILSSSNLVYYAPPEKTSYVVWIVIGAVAGSFLLIAVIVAIGVGICIYRKRKAVTKNKLDALATAAPIAEESKIPVAQNISVEQKPTSDSKPSISTTKTSEPPQAKKQISVVEVAKKPKANDPKAKNGQLGKTQKAKNDKASKKVSKKKEASLRTAVEIKPKIETKPAPIEKVEKLPTPMHKSVSEVKPDKKKNSKTEAKVKAKATLQNAPRNRIYHQPEDEGSEVLSDVDKPDKISPSVSVKVKLSNESKTRSKNSTTEGCSCTTTLEEITAKSMDSTQESSKRSAAKSLASTQETSSKRSITGDSKTVE